FEKLRNIADIIAGQSPPSSTYNSERKGIPFFQGKADYGEKYPSVRYWCTEPTKISLPNDILISMRAPVGPVNINIVESCIGRGLSAIRVKKNVSRDFIYFWLKQNQHIIAAKETGSTFKAITQKILNEIVVPFPCYSDQLQIANLLSKAENLIAQRKESIRLLDEFLKSTFLEMFGDPIANKKKWNLLQVSDYGESRLGKMLDGKKIIGNNLKPYLRNSNVLWFGFKLDDLLEMDFDEKDRVEFSLRNGDILMCEGGEIGRCAIWKDELEECYFQKAIHRIRLNKVIALPEYFVYMFWLYTMNGGLNKYMGAATISHLTGERLKKMKLPIPPIELQTPFAKIVEKTESLKTQYQQSLQELENLYGSLSQKAFKGELSIKDESLLMAAEPETKYGE
ncbi:MAG: restriction endonuclease subunit S, partial [Proteiniphilum sp.]|nr:restriction endonuclease subunit S [Proteiniphilum sp.]